MQPLIHGLAALVVALSGYAAELEVTEPPELPPILEKIAICESGGNHFEADGVTVKRGKVNPLDIGMFQINEKYHLEASKKLGLDIHTLEGNIAYALVLYRQEGTTPWNWSKSCWNRQVDL